MGAWMRIEMKRALIKHNYERPGLSQRELPAWAKLKPSTLTHPNAFVEASTSREVRSIARLRGHLFCLHAHAAA
ncbi:hypothetical protein PI125_g19854 [Phytophthora idaei]|nr:hypothetical protein PI125_g19854 [Phytophthora idaei]